jgi:hypothetical protein
MAFLSSLFGRLARLWNPPRYQWPYFVVESLHLTRAYCVVAELGIADLVSERARNVAELAQAAECDPRSLYPLLRALASFGVFSEDRHGNFHMTRRARVLLSEHPKSLRPWLIFMGRTELWQGFAHSLEAVKAGVPAFELAHDMSYYEYLAKHPEFASVFYQALSGWNEWQCREILKAYDFGRFQSVVDVGGGVGCLIQQILATHPHARGILFDQPETLRLAQPRFESAGHSDRCQFVGGSFFESVPSGAELYVLKSVLNDFSDEQAARILQSCHQAMSAEATLLVADSVVNPRNGVDRVVKLLDIERAALQRGRFRTREEFQTLLKQSGFELTGVHSTSVMDIQLLEAKKMPQLAVG